MDREEDELAAWTQRLRLDEADLLAREQRVLTEAPSPAELLVFAAEHDKIAGERDAIANRYDDLATGRVHVALGRDMHGSGRARRARSRERDQDAGILDRLAAGEDRDLAAGDRADSHDDRLRGRESREQAGEDRERAGDTRDRAVQQAADQAREIEGLRLALDSREVIGQAQGLLMAQYKMSGDAAFQVLVRLSQAENLKLRDIAAQIVDQAEGNRG